MKPPIKMKGRKSICGLFSVATSVTLIVVEYCRKEANYALITQAIGLLVLGIGLLLGKNL